MQWIPREEKSADNFFAGRVYFAERKHSFADQIFVYCFSISNTVDEKKTVLKYCFMKTPYKINDIYFYIECRYRGIIYTKMEHIFHSIIT